MRIEIGGQVYAIWCAYEDHPCAGTEEMLLGMDVLGNWRVSLDGPQKLLSIVQH